MERKFNCKNEELPIVAGYVSSNLSRDLADFTTYSPKFTQTYVDSFNSSIASVQELVNPKQETVELKQITERLYTAMDALIQPADYIQGYLKLGKNEIPVSAADFGLTALKSGVRKKDTENVLKNLQLVNANVAKYKTKLTALGLSEATAQLLIDSEPAIRQDNNLQYEIVSRRKVLVENNSGQLNSLYDQIMEICGIGKILYGKTDKTKASEYVFTTLLKSVRIVAKKKAETNA